jgi:Fur family ferric uptake transcriptional regulator
VTRRREVVLDSLDQAEGFRSAQDLYADLRGTGMRIGLATVYRALQALAASGDVDVLRTDSGEALYRRCGTRHHHHLVCRSCGKTVEVTAEPVEQWAQAVARRHGFREAAHTVEIFGVCRDCPHA